MIDLIGYGSANCSELSPAATLDSTHAAQRNGVGCTDTGNNSADFNASQPSARNSSTPAHDCGGSPSQSDAESYSNPGIQFNDRQTQAGDNPFYLEGTLPLLIVSYLPDDFSARRLPADLKRSHTDASAYAPQGMRAGPLRPRGASP